MNEFIIQLIVAWTKICMMFDGDCGAEEMGVSQAYLDIFFRRSSLDKSYPFD